jgi:hypothetical protein
MFSWFSSTLLLYFAVRLAIVESNLADHTNLEENRPGLFQDSHSIPHQFPSRKLQSFPKLYIKLLDASYLTKRLTLTIQDACSVYDGFECVRISSTDPKYVIDQIPTHIRLEFLKIDSYAEIEYSGYFSGPITLDINYLNSGGFVRQDYPGNNDFQGSPITTYSPTNLNFRFYYNYYSIRCIGYFLGPKSGMVKFGIKHDDKMIVWIQDFKKHEIEGWMDMT